MYSLQKLFTRYAVIKGAIRLPTAQFASSQNKNMDYETNDPKEKSFVDPVNYATKTDMEKSYRYDENREERVSQDKDLAGEFPKKIDIAKKYLNKNLFREDWNAENKKSDKGGKNAIN